MPKPAKINFPAPYLINQRAQYTLDLTPEDIKRLENCPEITVTKNHMERYEVLINFETLSATTLNTIRQTAPLYQKIAFQFINDARNIPDITKRFPSVQEQTAKVESKEDLFRTAWLGSELPKQIKVEADENVNPDKNLQLMFMMINTQTGLAPNRLVDPTVPLMRLGMPAAPMATTNLKETREDVIYRIEDQRIQFSSTQAHAIELFNVTRPTLDKKGNPQTDVVWQDIHAEVDITQNDSQFSCTHTIEITPHMAAELLRNSVESSINNDKVTISTQWQPLLNLPPAQKELMATIIEQNIPNLSHDIQALSTFAQTELPELSETKLLEFSKDEKALTVAMLSSLKDEKIPPHFIETVQAVAPSFSKNKEKYLARIQDKGIDELVTSVSKAKKQKSMINISTVAQGILVAAGIGVITALAVLGGPIGIALALTLGATLAIVGVGITAGTHAIGKHIVDNQLKSDIDTFAGADNFSPPLLTQEQKKEPDQEPKPVKPTDDDKPEQTVLRL